MQRAAVFALSGLTVLCAVPCFALTPAQEKAEKATLMAIENHLALATTVDEVFTHFDPDITLYDPFSGQKSGVESIKQAWHDQLDNFTNFKSDILRIKIEVDDHLAFAYSTQHFTATPRKSGAAPIDYVFRQTDCYHKVNGKWLVIHQHLSLPVDPATDKAVRDSK